MRYINLRFTYLLTYLLIWAKAKVRRVGPSESAHLSFIY